MVLHRKPVVVGHAANTLGRIRRYLSMNIPVIEMDVVESEGELLLHHVHEGLVIRPRRFNENPLHTLSAFRKLPLYLFPLRPPKLSEALELVGNRADLMFDLKTKGIGRKVVELLRKTGFRRTAYFSSKYHRDIVRIKELMPEAKGLLSLEDQPVNVADYVREARADGISIKAVFIDKELVNELHRYGYIIVVWTVNDVEVAKYVASLGADMIVTDIPDVIMEELYRDEEGGEESEVREDHSYVIMGGLEHMFGYEVSHTVSRRRSALLS